MGLPWEPDRVMVSRFAEQASAELRKQIDLMRTDLNRECDRLMMRLAERAKPSKSDAEIALSLAVKAMDSGEDPTKTRARAQEFLGFLREAKGEGK